MIPDEAVEALAKRNFHAEQDGSWYFLPESVKYGWRKEARAQCEAAAPHIQAGALEDAADVISNGAGQAPGVISIWLRKRSADIRGKRE